MNSRMREKASFRVFFYELSADLRGLTIPHTVHSVLYTVHDSTHVQQKQENKVKRKRKDVIELTTTSLSLFHMPLREGARF